MIEDETGTNSTEDINLEDKRKKDQRQNEKIRRRSQQALDQALDLEGVKSEVANISKMVSEFYSFLSNADALADQHPALEKAKDAVIAEGANYAKASQARKEIAKILQDTDVEWEDPRFDSAKAALKRGEFESAKDLVKANLEDKTSLEEQVKKILAGMDKDKGRVDTGETTAGSEGGFPKDIKEMKARLRGPGGAEFYRKNKEKVLKKAQELSR